MNQAVKEFWEGRAKRLVENNGDLGMWQSTSLTATETDASQRRDLELGALEEALKVIPNTQDLNLLDIGCGTGRLTIPLSKRFKKVYATDFMQKFLDLAKQNAMKKAVVILLFCPAKVMKYALIGNIIVVQFVAYFCVWMIHHIKKRCIRRNGLIM